MVRFDLAQIQPSSQTALSTTVFRVEPGLGPVRGASLASLHPTFSIQQRARIPLTRNFNRIRPSRGSTDGWRNIFPSARENSVLASSIDSPTRGKRTIEDAASSKGETGRQVKTNDLETQHKRGTVVAVAFEEARSLPRMRNLFTVDEARWEI